MDEKTIFLIFAIIAAFPVRYFLIRISKTLIQSHIEEEVNKIFLWFWDGTSEDRLYAWYKVRMVLKQREGEQDKIKFVDHRIYELDTRPMSGRLCVSKTGELIYENADLAKTTDG